MQAVTVKCPECGGMLDAGTSTTVTCPYCGAAARIQRRSQVFQLPRALPPVRPEDPPAVARQVPVKGPLIAVFVAAFIFVGGIVFSIVLTTRAASRASTASTSIASSGMAHVPAIDAPEPVHWRGGPPLVHDANGDGIDDLIGLRRYYSKQDKMAIVALSGKDGSVLWETPSLGTYIEVYRSKLALVDGVVLRGDTVANLYGFAAQDGKPL
ncbi:MAG: hypothetical protein NT062_28455 [Proteobacteria bacterium]|nr:hypothetical protein [Pseudomonadota bacterium]